MKNNDFDFIKEQFDNDGVTAPASLSEDKMRAKLDTAENAPVITVKKKNPRWLGGVAIAACLALIIGSATLLGRNGKPPVTAPAGVSGITEFKDYEALAKEVKDRGEANDSRGSFLFKNFAVAEKASDSATASADGEAAPGGKGVVGTAESFASTNKQVEAVDEADIIKTDAQYIYYVADAEKSTILIYSAADGETKQVGKIEQENQYTLVNEMFVHGDKLIAVGTRTDYREETGKNEDEEADGYDYKDGLYYNYYMGNPYTFVYTYDITDRSNPTLTDKYEQSGNYVSSRMLGDNVYVISGYGGYYYSGIKNEDFVPCVLTAEGEAEPLPIGDICAVEDSTNDRFSLIGAVDTKNGKSKKTKAILGVNEQVYCNEKNLYLTGTYYKDDTEYTRLVKYAVDGTKLTLKATGTAKGSVNDQFSMDEKDGNLRVALTDYRWGEGRDRNYLYVLDKNLNIIGQTESFAKNEHIEAVRFIGDTAYVITYEQTDPLFIIDLSDPTAPAIRGEVKIDGFSSFLTPVDENTLLGVGFATTEQEWGVMQDGVKLALFDIRKPTEPKVLDAFELKESDSEAQYSHKALTINPDKGYYVLPFHPYNRKVLKDGVSYYDGALLVRIENGKLSVDNLAADGYCKRCTYIGDYVYLPEAEGEAVYSFRADGKSGKSEPKKDAYSEADAIETARRYIEDETPYNAGDFSKVSCEYVKENEDYQNVYVVHYSKGDDTAGGDLTLIVDGDTHEVIDFTAGE